MIESVRRRLRACTIATAVLALIPAATIARQDLQPVIDANIPPPRQWTHHLTFPESIDGVRSIAFAPDRESVYVHYAVDVIDVWSLLIHYWPELLAAALALCTLLFILFARRVLRRKQTPGAPHCRLCNYDLSSQVARDANRKWVAAPDTRCPECGVLIARKRPYRGKGAAARLAPAFIAWSLLAAGYGLLLLTGIPRQGSLNKWFDWSSSDMATFASKRKVFQQFSAPGTRIVRVDSQSGAVDRLITTRCIDTYLQIAVTPDGRSLLISDNARSQLVLVSSRTGRRIALRKVIDLDSAATGLATSLVIGFTADSREAIIQHASGVSAWNMATGDLKQLIPGPFTQRVLMPRHRPDRFVQLMSGSGAVMDWRLQKSSSTSTEPTARVIRTSFAPSSSDVSVIDETGDRVFVLSQSGRALFELNLSTENIVESLSLGKNRIFLSGLAVNHDDSLLALSTSDRSLLIRDLQHLSWRAHLALPGEAYGALPAFSPDARWVAGVAYAGDGNANPFRKDLFLWNLAEILETSAPPTEPHPSSEEAP